jgi:predicted Abi (CAAX) family protease
MRMLQRSVLSLRLALSTWPDRTAWLSTLALFAAFALVAASLGYTSGLLRPGFANWSPAQALGFLALTFFLPALFEELVFRGLLLPHPHEAPSGFRASWTWLVLTVLVFVAYHPLNAWLLLPNARPIFWDPVFLVCAGMLGLLCAWTYRRTGSLWPAIFVHWWTVFLWKACFSGPLSYL